MKVATTTTTRRSPTRRNILYSGILGVILVLVSVWETRHLESVHQVFDLASYSAEMSAAPAVPSLRFLKTESPGWSVFNSTSTMPLYHDRGFKCRWERYESERNPGKSAEMCVHTSLDLISERIAKTGHWRDCLSVSRQYHASMRATRKKRSKESTLYHLEIGANIGACVVELLLSNDHVHIVAFEPFPKNVFCLTSTLLRNADFVRRVTVYPVALGSTPGSMQIAMQQRQNLGSVRIYTDKADLVRQQHLFARRYPVDGKVETIAVERLDDLLATTHQDSVVVPFAKLDAQGYECAILDGMPNLLSSIPRIINEVELESLSSYPNCSGQLLFERLRKVGMTLYWYRESGRLHPLPDEEQNINVVGVRP